MCLAIPAKIIEIEGDDSKVDYGGIIKVVNTSLVDDLKIGDYILIHAGFAIEKLDKENAILALKEIERYSKVVENA
ncbi:HypC/HybG/HupF family hydrogenase formation chaperone [Candidatus Woesearchaeota archaeon]|nr:MAG: HypC/HybG/HupF family hydrogenase formation chaperone [Candidatus Woesearchaeota archaeon]